MATTIQTREKPTKARALDTSGNNNHGQIYSGRALEFDGVTDYFQHNGGTALSGVNQFANGESWTFATWINFNDTKFTAFVGNDNSSKPFIGLHNSDFFQFRTASAGKYYKFDSTQTNALAGAEPLQENTWYRLVITAESDVLTCYLNGVQHGSTVTTSTNDTTNAVAFEGSAIEFSGWGGPYGSPRTHFLDGIMSDGQVWDAAWTAADASFDYLNPEQLALNRGGTSLTNSNLKIWYPMNDGHRGQQSYILDASNTGLGDEIITTTDLTTVGDATIAAGSTLNGWTHHATYQYDSVTASSSGIRIVSNGVNDLGSAFQSVHSNIFRATEGVTYRLEYSATKHSGGNLAITLRNAPVGSSLHITGANFITGSVTNEVIYFTADSSADGTDTVDFYVSATNAADWTISYVSLKPVNQKNHATTVFHGDMSDLLTSAQKTFFGNALDDNDNLFDFQGNNGDAGTTLIDSDGFTITNAHAVTGFYIAGNHGRLTNNSSAQALATLPIATVAGRTYQVFYDVAEGSSNINVSLGSSAAYNSSNASANQNDGTGKSLATAYTADDATSFLALQLTSSTNTHYCDVDNLKIVEVGTATGWTDADQQLHIPQTALQSYNQLAMPHGASNHKVDFSDGDSDLKFTTGNHSFSFWFCPQSTSNQYVLSKGAWGTSGYYIYFASTRKLQYHTNQGSSANQYNSLDNALTLGKWYHCVVAISDSGTDSQWYINGEEENKKTDHIAAVADTRNLQLYNRGGGSNNPDSGLTELSVWNKTLSQSEVKELYNDGISLDCKLHSASSDLLHYWRNGGLATWTDIGNAGSLYNGTPGNITETMLITAGADATRDSQGFLMNRQRLTNSFNNDYQENTATIGGIGHYVDVPGFNFHATVFSISCWIKSYTMGTNETILDKYYNTQNERAVRLYVITSGELQMQVSDDGSSNESQKTTDADLVADTWYHIVVTYSSGTFTAYRNGTALSVDANFGTETSIDQNVAPLRIGMSQDTKGSFNGQIDDLCIYDNKVLSATEVTRNYNAGKRSHRNG